MFLYEIVTHLRETKITQSFLHLFSFPTAHLHPSIPSPEVHRPLTAARRVLRPVALRSFPMDSEPNRRRRIREGSRTRGLRVGETEDQTAWRGNLSVEHGGGYAQWHFGRVCQHQTSGTESP